MTVIIPFTGQIIGLSQLLVSLQPQLHPDDDIYIVDSSKEKLAKNIVLKYGSTRCYIMVEQTETLITMQDVVKRGLESMKQNKQDGALIIFPENTISTTFIGNLKKAASHGDWNFLIPRVATSVGGIIDQNFNWFNPTTTTVVKVPFEENLEEFTPFYVPEREIDKDFNMSMTKNLRCGRFENELVAIHP